LGRGSPVKGSFAPFARPTLTVSDMADAQACKRPAGGAFGQWMNVNRASLAEQAAKDGMTGMTAATKKAGEVWKKMSAADKEPWEKKFKEAQAAFEAYKNSDGFVAPEKKEKRGKGDDKKKKKDAEAPKKPVGGAYGVFQNEKRDAFTKVAQAKGEKGFGAVAKIASEAFKALSEEEKKPYQEKVDKLMKAYKLAMVAYKEKKGADQPDEAEDPSPAKASPKSKKASAKASPAKAKAKASPAGKKREQPPKEAAAPPAKKGRSAAKGKDAEDSGLPKALLAAAEKEGLKVELENLAKRPEIKAKGLGGDALLEALKDAGGLVNKAKAALLGA